jgi:hypothetical protein
VEPAFIEFVVGWLFGGVAGGRRLLSVWIAFAARSIVEEFARTVRSV